MKRKKHTQHSTNITTQTNEKRDKLSRYWNDTSVAEDHTYIFQRFPQKTWQSEFTQMKRLADYASVLFDDLTFPEHRVISASD